MPNQIQKPYKSSLGSTKTFFTPHPEANYINAQDVAYELLTSAKDISIAAFQCFEDGNRLIIKAEVIANLIAEIQTKLEMIEQVLPLAFEGEEA